MCHATNGHSADRRRIGGEVGGWRRNLYITRTIASALPLRRMQGRNGHHGQCLQKPAATALAESVHAGAHHEYRRLRSATGLGGWSFHGHLFVRISETGGGIVFREIRAHIKKNTIRRSEWCRWTKHKSRSAERGQSRVELNDG